MSPTTIRKNLSHCVQHSIKIHIYLYIYWDPYINRWVLSFIALFTLVISYWVSPTLWLTLANIYRSLIHKLTQEQRRSIFTVASVVKSQFINDEQHLDSRHQNCPNQGEVKEWIWNVHITLGKMFLNTLRAERNSSSVLSTMCVIYECALGVFPVLLPGYSSQSSIN